MIKLINLFFILTTFLIGFQRIYPQTLFVEKIISLDFDIQDISINENKDYILIISKETNELIKIDRNGKILNRIGGFGWSESQFDFPSSIVSTAIDIYVSDYNNHRIQRFDNKLNFISQLQNSELINFEYPVSISLSSKGELYILDSKNKKILKVNGFSRLERTFGNYENGRITLMNPTKIKVDFNQVIYVLDSDKLILFDQYGNYLKTIPLIKDVVDFFVQDESILILTEENLYRLIDQNFEKVNIILLEENEIKFNSIKVSDGKIYLVSENKILILSDKY